MPGCHAQLSRLHLGHTLLLVDHILCRALVQFEAAPDHSCSRLQDVDDYVWCNSGSPAGSVYV